MSLVVHPRSGVVVQRESEIVLSSSADPTPAKRARLRSEDPPKWVRADRLAQVRRVSILPARDDSVGKNPYRLHLSIDPNFDPSSRSRRTGTLEGLELDVEEKDLLPLIRLSGREILIHYVIWDRDDDHNSAKEEILLLKSELEVVRRRLRETQDQLQISVESQLRDQRI